MREFAENAKTKGFWIGLFLFPIMVLASFPIMRWLETATPTRHFVLVDQSAGFETVANKGLDRLHAREVFKSLGEYQQKYAKEIPDAPEIDLESIPADSFSFTDDSSEALDQFIDMGGLEFAIAFMKPMLREDAPEFEEPKRSFRQVPLPEGVSADSDFSTLSQDLKPYLRGQKKITVDGEEVELFAAILIPDGVKSMAQGPGLATLAGTEKRGIEYWSTNLADDDLRDAVEDVINKEVRRLEYESRGVDAATVRNVQRIRVPFAKLNPKKEEGKEAVSVADILRQWAPVGFVYLLWVAIFTISQMLLNNTIEEKSNRIIEVLLSSVTARELMLGKLFGIAAVGLTMLFVWIGSLIGTLIYKQSAETEIATRLLVVLQTSGLLPAFAVYFILGYLMYAGIFLAIGSVCNTLKEAQNLMGAVMTVMIIPLFTMMFIPKDPNGTLATVMSWIPIYTPFVMMNRAAADPPMFDVVGTLILLVATTLLILWLTGKIFRAGILRTGQPPKLVELWRWIRS